MRAVVSGAGIAGLTLAWWLQADGWDVVLVERADGPRGGGYLMDFFGSGLDVVERMGLRTAVESAAVRVDELVYVAPSGRRRVRAPYDAISRALDGRVCSIMRGDLEAVLHAAFAAAPPVRYATVVTGVEPRAAGDRADVALSDGTLVRADLVVGADGVHSGVRALVHRPGPTVLRRLGYHTASYAFRDAALLSDVGRSFRVVSAPGRQVALYRTPGGQLAASLVHAADGDVPGRGLRRQALREAYRGLGDVVDRVLAACPQDASLYYDEVAQVELDGWSRGPVTLVGDACGAVSLMAGQGSSMAMGGAWALADELSRSRGDVAAALRRYEARVRPSVARKQAYGRSTARWLVPRSRWRMAARDVVLATSDLPGGHRLLRSSLAVARESVVEGHAVGASSSMCARPRTAGRTSTCPKTR